VPEWSAVAAIASGVSAGLAFLSLILVGSATRTQSKIAEFNNCVDIVKTLAEAQRKVRDKLDTPEYIFEFRELLNILETLSLLINEKKTTKTAKHYTLTFLIQALAWIEVDQSMKSLIEISVTGIDTFEDLITIRRRYRERIEQLAEQYRNS
jgi:hypothetical protein